MYDFLNKIQTCKHQHKVASDFSENTGQGILEQDSSENTLKELVMKTFKHFYPLEPIMRDCSVFKVAASLDNLFNKNNNIEDIEIGLNLGNELSNAGHLDVSNATNAIEIT